MPQPQPLALTDDQLATIHRAAQPLAPDLRSPFLRAVAHRLAREPVLGDGSVARVCREVAREFFQPPDLSRAAGSSKYSR